MYPHTHVDNELRRRGIDPALLDEHDTDDLLLHVLCRDYLGQVGEQRRAWRALREMVDSLPNAEDDDPRDDHPVAWLDSTVLVAASSAVQRYDRAVLTRRATGRRLAGLVAQWKLRHPAPDTSAREDGQD